MAWDWYAVEQEVRLRHASARRHAALAHRAAEARRGPGQGERLLHRLGRELLAWGRQWRRDYQARQMRQTQERRGAT
ncbi:MAG TPA: hypothetical protein VH257_15285 [Chloroflexota bacterium]|nr:hypothetical protein [Chloroflexota bacterium]